MAKINKIQRNNVIATDVPGVLIRDVPMKQMTDIFARHSSAEEGTLDGVLIFFQELICDKNGELFEDAQTLEDIELNMPMSLFKEIIAAIPKALNPDANDLGK